MAIEDLKYYLKTRYGYSKHKDLGYVRAMRNKTSKEVELLRKQVVGTQGEEKKIVLPGVNQHARNDRRKKTNRDPDEVIDKFAAQGR